MITARMIRILGVSAVMSAMLIGAAHAQTEDKRVLFTFNVPVAIPGVTLAPGQYLFRIADPGPTGSRRVIQVASPDGKKSYALLFTHAADRNEVTAAPEVRFMETGAGMPSAVRTWWYTNERTGYEFIYPKAQARQLAEGVHAPVLTTVEETTKPEETVNAHLEYLEPGGHETDLAATAPVAASGSTEVGRIASADIAGAEPRTALPKTASELPLVGLIGLIGLGAAAAIRTWVIART